MTPTIYFYVNEHGISIGFQGEDYSVQVILTQAELKCSRSTKSLLHLLMGKMQTLLLSIDDREIL